ncbi:unnamed protein product [Aphanomyces euteiches]
MSYWGSQDAIVEEQKAKWRYDKVHEGLTEWEQDHPSFKAWNVQHIQLQMLLSDVEDRWKKAQENARLSGSRPATTRNTMKNAMRLRNHVSAALREWKSEHPNCDILDPERQQLLELRREADKRLMAAREVADVLKSSGSKKKRKKYSDMDIEESCRKFLDAIARKLAESYDFPREFEDFAIMEDVFRAIDSNTWTRKSAYQVSLPEFYPNEEWQALRTLLDDTIDLRNKNREPFRTSRGEIVVALPHDGFENYCHVLKKVAQICASCGDDGDWDPSALVFIDEQDLGFASTLLNDQQQ